MIEEIRELFQNLIAPQLESIKGDIKALDVKIDTKTDALDAKIGALDVTIQRDEPYKTVKTDSTKGREQIIALVHGLVEIANWLTPFMPQTSAIIIDLIRANRVPTQPLFPRK